VGVCALETDRRCAGTLFDKQVAGWDNDKAGIIMSASKWVASVTILAALDQVRGEPSSPGGADVAALSPGFARMWRGEPILRAGGRSLAQLKACRLLLVVRPFPWVRVGARARVRGLASCNMDGRSFMLGPLLGGPRPTRAQT
jgi:hypothetical protein